MAPYRTKWNVYQNAVCWIDLKSGQDRRLERWQTNSDAIIPDNTVPADGLEKVAHHKTGEILYQKIRLSPRPSPNPQKCLACSTREHWETCCRPGDDKTRSRFKLSGVSHEEPDKTTKTRRKQDIGRLVQAVRLVQTTMLSVLELQSDSPFTPSSEESKHMIHSLGYVEGFELCQNLSPPSMSSVCEVL